MAFPEIRPVVGLTVGIPDTSHPVNLPASGIVAGDLLFSLIDCNGGTIPTFDNTTFGAWRAIDSASNGADHSYRIDAKIADGTENGGTLTHTVSPAGRLTSIIFAISGFSGNINDIEAGTPTINAAGLSHDPPSLTASWGAEDNLWLVTLAMNNGQSVIDVWPTGYTLQQTEGGDGGLQGSAVAMAGRQLAAATENPDDFVTLAGTGAIANTVAIRPVATPTGPVLSAPTAPTALTVSTMSAQVTTDTGNGNLWAVLTGSPTTPSIAQIKAGQDHTGATADSAVANQAITATGAQTVNFSGVTPNADRYAHFVQTDSGANDSNAISSAAGQIITIPNPELTFTPQTDVEPSTVVTSNSVTVQGINVPVPVSSSITSGDGTLPLFSVNGDAFSNTTRNITAGQTLQLRHTSSANFDTNTVQRASFNAGDATPGFSSGTRVANVPLLSAPTATATGTTTMDISVVSNRAGDGTIYYVTDTNPNQPSAAQIKAGLNAAGTPAFRSGNQVPVTTNSWSLTGLGAFVQYYTWFIQEGAESDSSIAGANATTNSAPPTFTEQPTQSAVPGQTNFSFQATAQDNNDSAQVMTHWARVYEGGAPTPTDQQVKDGTGTGVVAATGVGQRTNVASGLQQLWTASGLTANTAYRIEYVAQNNQGQDVRATALAFTTAASQPTITTVNGGQDPTNAQASVVIEGTNFGAAQGTGFVRYNGVVFQQASILNWTDTAVTVQWPDIPNDVGFESTRLGGAVSNDLQVFTDTGQNATAQVSTLPEATAMFGGISDTLGSPSIFSNDTFAVNDEAYGRWTGGVPNGPVGGGDAYERDGNARLTGNIRGIVKGAQLDYRIFDLGLQQWSNSSPELFNENTGVVVSNVNGNNVVVSGSTGNVINGLNLGQTASVELDDGTKRLAGTALAVASDAVTFTLPLTTGAAAPNQIKYGTTLALRVDGGLGLTVLPNVTHNPPAGNAYIDITSVNATPLWPNKALEGPPAVGDQYQYATVSSPGNYPVTVNADGTYSVATNGDLTVQTVTMFRYAAATNTWAAANATYQEPAPTLTGFGAINGTTTATGSGTTNKPSGSVYAQVRVAADPAPSAADIIAGTGGVGTPNPSTVASQYPNPSDLPQITGLTAETAYVMYATYNDGTQSSVVQSFAFTTNAEPVAPPQFVGTISEQTAQEGTTNVLFDFRPFFDPAQTGVGGDPDTYSIAPTALPASVTFNASGFISGDVTDAVATYGPYTVTATNAAGSATSNAFNITISAAPVIPPSWGAIPPLAGIVGQPVAASLDNYIVGGDPVTLYGHIDPLPPGITLNTATGAFEGTYTGETTLGAIQVFAENAGGRVETTIPSWVVAAATVAPVWGTVPNITVQENSVTDIDLNQYLTAGDAPITFSSTGTALPAGVSLASNGTLSFDGTQVAGTTTGVLFTAVNAGGADESNAVSIIVQAIGPTPTGDAGGFGPFVGISIGIPGTL